MNTVRPLILLALTTLFVHAAVAEESLSYPRFLKMVLEQNLSLKIETAKSGAADANAKSINIPPPMIGYARLTDQSGSSASGFEVSQSIPFPTKILSNHSARNFEAQAQNENRLAMESEIRAKAKSIYFNLWAGQARKDALKEKKQVIENHIRLSRAGVRSDSFLRIHLLKAEADLDLLENDLIAVNQEIRERAATVAEFLNVDPTDFHPVLEEPPLTTMPEESELANPHQLEAARFTLESFKARNDESKASWFPDLYLRYKEMGQTQLMPKTSEVMVGVSLPFLFPWDTSSSVGKASGERLRSELEYEREKRRFTTAKTVILSKAISLKQQLDNLTTKLLPRAEKRMKLVHNLAPRDMDTLQDHRETMEAFPELKIKALELRTRYEETIAELLKFERSTK